MAQIKEFDADGFRVATYLDPTVFLCDINYRRLQRLHGCLE